LSMSQNQSMILMSTLRPLQIERAQASVEAEVG
jgi:hypothetical protein